MIEVTADDLRKLRDEVKERGAPATNAGAGGGDPVKMHETAIAVAQELDVEDLAEVDALLLTGRETFASPTPPLTAHEALDLGDMARGERGGRLEDRSQGHQQRRAAPEPACGRPVGKCSKHHVGLLSPAGAGAFAKVDTTLGRILGRAPHRIRDILGRALG